MKTLFLTGAALAALPLLAGHAQAQAAAAPSFGDPITVGPGVTIDPILNARLRWEDVDATTKTADAETLRIRSGFEIREASSHLGFLVEATGTLAFGKGYNAFSSPTRGNQYRPGRAVIADPENIGLNRIQIQYATKAVTVTVGRQRIEMDDQRFVGSAPWRQNEQTFDAARVQLRGGALVLDATYADRQNSILGTSGAPRDYYRGKFIFASGGLQMPGLALKGFAYVLDYDPTAFGAQNNSSQTYGLRAVSTVPAGPFTLHILTSAARQANYALNPSRYHAFYTTNELGLEVWHQTAAFGFESLGADRRATGPVHSVQTPLASLHKFDGTADMFLVTPVNGLNDTYVSLSGAFPTLHGLSYGVTYHMFGSAIQGQKYGNEIDAQVGIKTGKITWLAKYAKYEARGFGLDTRKFWLQAEYGF